ncbi:MAG TPA: hypothetical protein VJB69_00950 [Candidatus Paceibacterota bacterium]
MNQKKIIPAIIGQTYSEIERQIKILEGHTDWVHLDITDGRFTSSESWNAPEDFSFLDGKSKIEIHLMVESLEEIIGDWAEVADQIIIHQEATENLREIFDSFTSSVVKIGVALLLSTPVETLSPYLSKISLVQLMSIAEIGEQGHSFDNRVLEKVKRLRALAPNVIIQIDGGVNLKTAKLAFEAGVDNLVVGSAIWQTPDPLISLKNFQSLLKANS